MLLILSLQSSMPIQTERSDEGVKNRTENSLLLLNDVFCIISGPQRMIEKLTEKTFHDTFKKGTLQFLFHRLMHMNAQDQKCKLISKMFTVWFGEL